MWIILHSGGLQRTGGRLVPHSCKLVLCIVSLFELIYKLEASLLGLAARREKKTKGVTGFFLVARK